MAPSAIPHVEVAGVLDTQGIVLPEPLSVNGIINRRAGAPKLVAGVAASSSSDAFKSPVGYLH